MNQKNKYGVFFWNIMGTICNALFSVLSLSIVTRFTDARQSDLYSIAFSITTMYAALGTFQVRNFQATDVKEKYTFSQYYLFRLLTCTVMLAAVAIDCQLRGYSQERTLVVVGLCVYRILDSIADVYGGLLQQKERLDIAGKALSLRIVVSATLFGIALAVWGNLMYAVLFLVAGSIVCILVYDIPQSRKYEQLRLKQLVCREVLKSCAGICRECFPLFLNGFLILYIYNIPKNTIDAAILSGGMTDGTLAVYNILFMPASVLNLLLIVFRPYLTRMSLFWLENRRSDLLHVMVKILIGLGICMPFVVLAGYLIGIPALEIVYGYELSAYRTELLLLLLGGCINTLGIYFENIVTVIRKQKYMLCSYCCALLAAVTISRDFVERWQIRGAAYVYIIAMLIVMVGNGIIFAAGFRKKVGENR